MRNPDICRAGPKAVPSADMKIAIALLLGLGCAAAPRPRVIDVHLHLEPQTPALAMKVPDPVSGAPMSVTDEKSLREALTRAMDEAGVERAMVSGDAAAIARWKALAPSRIIANCNFDEVSKLDIAALRRAHAAGMCDALAEISPEYEGIAPDDARLEPLWALAEELDIPVGYHLYPGGPPNARDLGVAPALLISAGHPLSFLPVLNRHPKLRLWIMHAGWPFLDETLALLYAYERVDVDIGVIDWVLTPALLDESRRGEGPHEFYRYLQALADAGFSKRILFGSDAMVWPDAIPRAVRNVEAAPFLSAQQKQDILHDNAVRFFRWK